MNQTRPPGASRRAVLTGAGTALAGAIALGGCGRAATARKAVKRLPKALMESDVRILSAALALERRAVAAYVAGIPLLPHPQAKAARQFLNEELEHTGELISLITAAGAKPPPRADSYPLGHPSDGAGVLALLHSLETLQVSNYLQSIPHLSPGPVRAAVASILTVDAQHLTMVRFIQGQTPVPSAFVSGAE
ncbi:MAG TPA: ferritin-like domain-containing protein [Solirubrobacteraceae bacterium]